MTMERLTKAASAAGFAMVLNEDLGQPVVPAPQVSPQPIPATGTALVVGKPMPAPSWTEQWRLWTQGATPAA